MAFKYRIALFAYLVHQFAGFTLNQLFFGGEIGLLHPFPDGVRYFFSLLLGIFNKSACCFDRIDNFVFHAAPPQRFRGVFYGNTVLTAIIFLNKNKNKRKIKSIAPPRKIVIM